MEKIIITIPDNLSKDQELLAIGNELHKQILTSGTKFKMLGDSVSIKHSETQITIKREPVEKPITTQVCSACDTIFEPSLGYKLWVNYGAKPRQVTYCSEDCRGAVMDFCGKGRAAIKKSELGSVIIF